jgi:hypothetical protein
MQGIVAHENGAYVKAAIVKLYRVKNAGDEPDAEFVTYAETDKDGNFIIQDLNPDEKYIIEIHAKYPETGIKEDAVEVQEPGTEQTPEPVLEANEEPVEEEGKYPNQDAKEAKAEATGAEATVIAEAEEAAIEAEEEPDVAEDVMKPYFDGEGPDLDFDDEEEAFAEEYGETGGFVSDFAAEAFESSQIDYKITENLSVNNSYPMSDYLKDKPYLLKNNLW